MASPDVVTVAVGDELTVRLESTPSTGYLWTVSSLPEGLELSGSEYEGQTGGAKPGDPTVQVFRFRATKAGEHAVTLVLKRRWESQALASHTVTVRAR